MPTIAWVIVVGLPTGSKACVVSPTRVPPWRLQALAEGDLSERARRRAAELANDADLRLAPPKDNPANHGVLAWRSTPQ